VKTAPGWLRGRHLLKLFAACFLTVWLLLLAWRTVDILLFTKGYGAMIWEGEKGVGQLTWLGTVHCGSVAAWVFVAALDLMPTALFCSVFILLVLRWASKWEHRRSVVLSGALLASGCVATKTHAATLPQ